MGNLHKGIYKFMIKSSWILLGIKIFETIFVQEIKTYIMFNNFLELRNFMIFFPPPSIYCNLSDDIQQLCWRSLLMACSRYVQWYISYLSSVAVNWCLALHRCGFCITYSDTPQSIGLLWTSDQPVAETSTWQHTTLTTDRHPCPPVAFEPTISAGERPQTYALDRAATGTR